MNFAKIFTKSLFVIFIALLPFHALFITTIKCKFWIDTNILRFWKEWLIILLLLATLIELHFRKRKFNELLKWNYLVWTTIAFIICSLFYIWFPYLEFKVSNFLGFKYDVFFLFCLIIWIYLNFIKDNFKLLLNTIFVSWFISIVIFLPWYLFWDISALSSIFWYSDKVSTYTANSCISFSQNVEWWHHRFQWTFGSPINISIFFVVFYLIYIWYILKKDYKNYNKVLLIAIPSLFVFPSIFFSYSKTSILWLLFWASIFIYLSNKFIFKKTLKKWQIYYVYWILIFLILGFVIAKRDLFLHPDAVFNRLDNLSRSVEMFTYNPIWYWLWVAWPASQIWRSIESLWNWQIMAQSTSATALFLPENWYIQILLEQWILWLSLFLSIFIIIWLKLYKIIQVKKDYLSIAIFSSFIAICFMALVCHAFEDSAIVYPLFLIIWAYIWKNSKLN